MRTLSLNECSVSSKDKACWELTVLEVKKCQFCTTMLHDIDISEGWFASLHNTKNATGFMEYYAIGLRIVQLSNVDCSVKTLRFPPKVVCEVSSRRGASFIVPPIMYPTSGAGALTGS